MSAPNPFSAISQGLSNMATGAAGGGGGVIGHLLGSHLQRQNAEHAAGLVMQLADHHHAHQKALAEHEQRLKQRQVGFEKGTDHTNAKDMASHQHMLSEQAAVGSRSHEINVIHAQAAGDAHRHASQFGAQGQNRISEIKEMGRQERKTIKTRGSVSKDLRSNGVDPSVITSAPSRKATLNPTTASSGPASPAKPKAPRAPSVGQKPSKP